MPNKYKVVVVGMGKRGMHHAAAFQANERFEIAGICDTDESRLDAAVAKLGVATKGTPARLLSKQDPISSASARRPTCAPGWSAWESKAGHGSSPWRSRWH